MACPYKRYGVPLQNVMACPYKRYGVPLQTPWRAPTMMVG
jgi:energy-converting hydrogenase Eha subunit F